MFESLFVLVLFGLVYVDIIECLEKFGHSDTWPQRELHLESQDTPRR